MKKVLEDSFDSIERVVQQDTYPGASGWPYVALVFGFLGCYILVGWLGLPSEIQSAITGLAGVVVGGHRARTYRPRNRRKR